MPRPVFDINEYELRGVEPEVFSELQRTSLNKVLSRANGQMDWTAQLLGLSGTNYWGHSNQRADGSYDWVGLPETMNEKRQMQAGVYGVYGKDKAYADRPAPFNRKEVLASGDATFHIWEEDGKTLYSPLDQIDALPYGAHNVLFPHSNYKFDEYVEFLVPNGSVSSTLVHKYFRIFDKEWTRFTLKQTSSVIQVRIKGSKADYAMIPVIDWEDPSDWTSQRTLDNFTGLWGNKGASPSFDVAFDALDIHGFDEQFALTLTDTKSCFSITELLAKVGLKPTLWTPFYNKMFGFKIGDCPIIYAEEPWNVNEAIIDNGTFEALVPDPPQDELIDATFATQGSQTSTVEDGIYPLIWADDDYLPSPHTVTHLSGCVLNCFFHLSVI